MIKDENFITIQGFMVNKLKLKGNDLVVYAIIFGFSQLKNQRFTGSLQYLADWTNSSKQGIQKNLKSLLDKGLISKEDKIINGVKFVEYYATELYRVCNSVDKGIQHSCTNNIYNNINNKTTEENSIDFYENNFGLLTPIIADKINSYLEDGIEDKLIMEAMKKAVENNARKWSYVQTILNDCINNNIKTVHDFEIQQKEYREKKTTKTTTLKKEVEYNTDFSEYDKYVK